MFFNKKVRQLDSFFTYTTKPCILQSRPHLICAGFVASSLQARDLNRTRDLTAANSLPMVLYTVLTFDLVSKSAEELDKIGYVKLKPMGAEVKSKGLARRMRQMSDPLCSVPAFNHVSLYMLGGKAHTQQQRSAFLSVHI